jgi:hypothetical protein
MEAIAVILFYTVSSSMLITVGCVSFTAIVEDITVGFIFL